MIPDIDISNVILRTPRMILRPWSRDDLEDLYAYAVDPDVGPMAGWEPHASIEESKEILKRFLCDKKTFALEYQGHVVGSLGVERYDETQFPELAELRVREIGYVLAKNCWGLGLMPEAVKEVIRWLFEEEKLDVVLCGHFLRNGQSRRVQEKCGFRHYAYGSFHTKNNTVEELETRILTREEWLRLQAVN